MVGVRVAPEDRVERRAPGVERHAQLAVEGLVAAERRLRDLAERGGLRAARDVRDRRPLEHPPGGGVAPPLHAPHAHVLDAPGVPAGADDVVAHLGRREALVALDGDARDQELGDARLAQVFEQAAELRGERARVEHQLLGQGLRPAHLERAAPPALGLGRWRQPSAAKSRRQQPVGDLCRPPGFRLQRSAELAQPRGDLAASRSSTNSSLPGSTYFRNGASTSGTASFGR